MENPLISIIVPVFRVEQYLSRCVDSIINQTYKNLEIILVDDGSDDSCPAICDDYASKDKRITVIHKPNGGLSSARNAGLDMAKGEYIGFVDSDDVVESDMYETLLKDLCDTNSDVIICDYENWDGISPFEKQSVNQLATYSRKEMLKVFLRVNQPILYTSACSRLYLRKAISNIRFTQGIINEDVDFSYKVFLNCNKVSITDARKYKYFISNTSITRNRLTPKDFDFYTVWENVVEMAKKFDKDNLCFAELNLKRVDFTLLLKYAMFGIKGFENPKQVIKEMQNRLRKNKNELLKSKGLTASRKIAVLLLSFNVNFVKLLFDWGIINKQL